MANGENGKSDGKYLWRDAQRVLLLPLIIGSGGIGLYSGNVLSVRITAEREARLHLYASIREIRAELRTEIREHEKLVGHAGMERKEAKIEEQFRSFERRVGRCEGHLMKFKGIE